MAKADLSAQPLQSTPCVHAVVCGIRCVRIWTERANSVGHPLVYPLGSGARNHAYIVPGVGCTKEETTSRFQHTDYFTKESLRTLHVFEHVVGIDYVEAFIGEWYRVGDVHYCCMIQLGVLQDCGVWIASRYSPAVTPHITSFVISREWTIT